jgi:hypothetical protein
MKERVKGELGPLAEVISILMPWHFLRVAIEGEVVNLVVETDGSDRR